MKYFISVILLFNITCSLLSAQTIRILVKPVDSKYWGYSDEKGNFFEARYLYCEPFSEDGFAIVYSSARKEYRVIDRFGKEMKTEITGFDLKDVMSYYPNKFSGGLLVMRQANKWGALDTSGKLVIPMKWNTLLEFQDGYGLGMIKNQFYLIHVSGKETLLSEEIVEVKQFQDGLAPCKFKNGMEGYIDTTGKIAIKPEFLQVGYFNDSVAWAKGQDGLIGYINKKGEWIIKPLFEAAKDMDPESGLARVKFKNRWLFVNKTGEFIDFGLTDIMDDFHDGLAKGRKDGLVGFYNNRGEWFIKPQFINARDFCNGYAAASTSGSNSELWGIIDKNGKWLIEPIFRSSKDVVILKP